MVAPAASPGVDPKTSLHIGMCVVLIVAVAAIFYYRSAIEQLKEPIVIVILFAVLSAIFTVFFVGFFSTWAKITHDKYLMGGAGAVFLVFLASLVLAWLATGGSDLPEQEAELAKKQRKIEVLEGEIQYLAGQLKTLEDFKAVITSTIAKSEQVQSSLSAELNETVVDFERYLGALKSKIGYGAVEFSVSCASYGATLKEEQISYEVQVGSKRIDRDKRMLTAGVNTFDLVNGSNELMFTGRREHTEEPVVTIRIQMHPQKDNVPYIGILFHDTAFKPCINRDSAVQLINLDSRQMLAVPPHLSGG